VYHRDRARAEKTLPTRVASRTHQPHAPASRTSLARKPHAPSLASLRSREAAVFRKRLGPRCFVPLARDQTAHVLHIQTAYILRSPKYLYAFRLFNRTPIKWHAEHRGSAGHVQRQNHDVINWNGLTLRFSRNSNICTGRHGAVTPAKGSCFFCRGCLDAHHAHCNGFRATRPISRLEG
jgi:hypothetical protein